MGYAKQKGFSLVEMLVAITIFGIVGVVMMGFFIANTKTYTAQTQVVDMQQEARGGLDFFAREFRSAGYDPTRSENFGVTQATPTSLTFTVDSNGNGTVDGGETMTYTIAGDEFTRNGQPLAENINEVRFAYAFDADEDGSLDADGGDRVYWAVIDVGSGNWFELDANDDGGISLADDTDADENMNLQDTGIVADLEDIRAVRIWLLVQTENEDRDYSNNQSYVVGNLIQPTGDGFRRRIRTTIVTGRNLDI